jgi:hypothetical protein
VFAGGIHVALFTGYTLGVYLWERFTSPAVGGKLGVP